MAKPKKTNSPGGSRISGARSGHGVLRQAIRMQDRLLHREMGAWPGDQRDDDEPGAQTGGADPVNDALSDRREARRSRKVSDRLD
jgi:hypothetical protein